MPGAALRRHLHLTINLQEVSPAWLQSRDTHLQVLCEEGPQLCLQQLSVGGRGEEREGGQESETAGRLEVGAGAPGQREAHRSAHPEGRPGPPAQGCRGLGRPQNSEASCCGPPGTWLPIPHLPEGPLGKRATGASRVPRAGPPTPPAQIPGWRTPEAGSSLSSCRCCLQLPQVRQDRLREVK